MRDLYIIQLQTNNDTNKVIIITLFLFSYSILFFYCSLNIKKENESMHGAWLYKWSIEDKTLFQNDCNSQGLSVFSSWELEQLGESSLADRDLTQLAIEHSKKKLTASLFAGFILKT